MGVFLFVLLIIFIIVVLPLWILLNFLGGQRSTRQLSAGEEQMLGDLWRMAQTMENRVAVLEEHLRTSKKERNTP